ncbi:MAG: DUF362 domain-containing protein [Acidobacteriaceae bacterium]|nr:DUF362 domain-containing protein [Acidobacteriaceae bacterium]
MMNRRHFLLGSFACLAACHGNRTSLRHSVTIARAASYSADLVDLIRRILVEHRVAVKGQRILLKPNLVEFSSSAPINTHPVLVASVVEAFISLGAAQVCIGEGPGHRRMTLDMAEAAGFFQSIPGFEKRFTDLNIDAVVLTRLPRPFSSLSGLYLPQTVFDCDLVVSLPKMKTHHWTGATLSMKNLFGIVPGAVYGWPKNILHWAGIDECIADLHFLFPRQFSIVDGIEGMEGNGPILGTPKWAGVVVAGSHPPSVDATCCEIMQIDPRKIKYLKLISRRDPAWNIGASRQIGESIESVGTRFALHPDLEALRLVV